MSNLCCKNDEKAAIDTQQNITKSCDCAKRNVFFRLAEFMCCAQEFRWNLF